VLYVHPLVKAGLAGQLAGALRLKREENGGQRRETRRNVAESTHRSSDDVIAESEKEHVDKSSGMADVDLACDLMFKIVHATP
jgi:hypothetical protein